VVVWTHSVSSVDSIGSQIVRVNQMHRDDDALAAGQFPRLVGDGDSSSVYGGIASFVLETVYG
jgi:hypothetical protein